MMKKLTTIAIFLLTMALLPAQEIEVTGEVVTVDEVAYEDGDVYVLQAQIRTRNQERIMAEIGPAWFLESDVAPGDEVTVRGKYLEADKFRVREMIRNNVRHLIRNEGYEPLWLRTRLRAENHLYDPRSEKTIKGDIADLYLEDDSETMEAVVETQSGELVRVRLAPEWYLRNRLRVGDEIEVRGATVKDKGEMMIMAREMRNLTTNLETALRNRQGFPDWCGQGKSAEKQQGKPRVNDEHVGHGRGHGN
ncbi:MAG: hypothetical protein WBE28_11915 [bacterium]